MSDIGGYIPLSQRTRVAKPQDLLSDEDVQQIIATIPSRFSQSALIRHMAEAERTAYCQGVADTTKPTGG
jgi:hypothetical protein